MDENIISQCVPMKARIFFVKADVIQIFKNYEL
jgi:hypothetical protein